MADTIRESIIASLIDKLGEISTANGYNTECGQDVRRAAYYFTEDELPGISVFPLVETATAETLGISAHVMPIQVRAIFAHSTVNQPSEYGERVLGDVITCLCGMEYQLTFTSGGTYTIKAGDTLTGATSGATAKVLSVSVSTGSWAAGTASGTIRITNTSGAFMAENLDVGDNLNVCTIAAAASSYPAKWAATGSTKDTIIYRGGGIEDYPQHDDHVTVVVINFDVRYQTTATSPYTRP